jgi:hypothetical protein
MREAHNEASVLICETVAESLQEPMEALPPLSSAIDFDGLDALVTDDPSHDVTITFTYAGMRVLVHSGPTVYVRPIHDESKSPRDRPV